MEKFLVWCGLKLITKKLCCLLHFQVGFSSEFLAGEKKKFELLLSCIFLVFVIRHVWKGGGGEVVLQDEGFLVKLLISFYLFIIYSPAFSNSFFHFSKFIYILS